jgi:hypothetical protein
VRIAATSDRDELLAITHRQRRTTPRLADDRVATRAHTEVRDASREQRFRGASGRKAFTDRTKAKAPAGQAEKERFTLCENLLEPYPIKVAF